MVLEIFDTKFLSEEEKTDTKDFIGKKKDGLILMKGGRRSGKKTASIKYKEFIINRNKLK